MSGQTQVDGRVAERAAIRAFAKRRGIHDPGEAVRRYRLANGESGMPTRERVTTAREAVAQAAARTEEGRVELRAFALRHRIYNLDLARDRFIAERGYAPA